MVCAPHAARIFRLPGLRHDLPPRYVCRVSRNAELQLGHLARRFFSFATALPLTSQELDNARIRLGSDELSDLFFAQPVADQRHGYDASTWLEARESPSWMVQAGMLHDIGKRHARMGRWGRATTTALSWVRVVPRGRMSIYTAHGLIGAEELAARGVDARIVAYTAHHHDRRPAELTGAEWNQLDEADRRN